MNTKQIKIKSTQQTAPHGPMHSEFISEGFWKRDKGETIYVYDESELSGMEGSQTTLKLNENHQLTIIRTGPESSTIMEFTEKKVSHSPYITAYGTFNLTIHTHKINVNIDDFGNGTIELIYYLTINNTEKTRHHLLVSVTSLESA